MSANAQRVETENLGLTAIPQQPSIGAEIRSIDLAVPLTYELREQVRHLLLRYKLLFFRDQDITRQQHIDFGRQFGDSMYIPWYRYDNLERKAEIERQYPPVEHAVVWTHPETGAKVLFVNSAFTSQIVGLEKEESGRLLAHLRSRFVQPEYQVRFKWRPGRSPSGTTDRHSTTAYGILVTRLGSWSG
jgi:alpha-ketoglutarate-dependent taurine dioxygenase